MIISCIAIDDEPLALAKIESYISNIREISLIRTFDNAIEAMGWLKENETDLIFLDIRMEMLTGIQFLETLETKARVIITSAFDQYALKGYEFDVTDYLLKPYSFPRFAQAVSKVMTYYSEKQKETTESIIKGRFIFVKTEYRLERVDFDEILYIEGMKDYLRIICTNRKIMTLQSFAKIEESLPPKEFCRVHKSYMVAIKKIKSVERGIIIIADQRIPVSNTYKEEFYAKIKA